MGVLFQKYVTCSIGAFNYMYVSYKNSAMCHRYVSNSIGVCFHKYRVKQKKGTFEKPPQKLKKSKKKKIIDRNWTISTCLLRDSNPNYQCLKITSCRWRPPPRMHSFTATLRILQSMQHTQGDTKERKLLKCVVAVKECVRGGGSHLQDVIFKHW